MNDCERLGQLIEGGDGCLSIVTHEEHCALEIVRKTAEKLRRDMWVWSIAEGVRDGLIDGGPAIANTDGPTAGLTNLSQARPGSLCVTLDLAEHLKGGKALRILREMIDSLDRTGLTLVMIDHTDRLPDAIKAYTRPFEISFPDEKELLQIIRGTLQRLRRKKPIEVGITQKGLDTIVRNLRGLTRRQAMRIINDAVAADQRFSDDDINIVIANKRRMIQQGGLLEKFDLTALGEASEGYSGAEIEQAVTSALHAAYADKADLDTERLIAAVRVSPPLSVTMVEKVRALRQWGQGRCVPAD